MPIRPENKARYPADWPEIRTRILRRALWRCEWPGCEALHRDAGYKRTAAATRKANAQTADMFGTGDTE